MIIPPDQNKRAELMWRAISREVDFRRKKVIDLGCGTGDFLWRTWIAGARFTWGIERNYAVIKPFFEDTLDEEGKRPYSSQITIGIQDLNTMRGELIVDYDIAMCFSVLPYLDDPAKTVQWMSDMFPLCIIEAQYEPEPYCMKRIGSDTGMTQFLLDNGFHKVRPIGKTYIDIRDTWRTIWLCQK